MKGETAGRQFSFRYKNWDIEVLFDSSRRPRGVLRTQIAQWIESGYESSHAQGGEVSSADGSYAYKFRRIE